MVRVAAAAGYFDGAFFGEAADVDGEEAHEEQSGEEDDDGQGHG